MYKSTLLVFAVVCQSPLAGAEIKKEKLAGQWHPAHVEYMVHSGSTAYAQPPTRTDRAFSIHLIGQAAQQLFEQIGPDQKEMCSSERGDRERRNKGALCQYSARLDSTSDSHYRCWIGIDLRTGDGQVRTPC